MNYKLMITTIITLASTSCSKDNFSGGAYSINKPSPPKAEDLRESNVSIQNIDTDTGNLIQLSKGSLLKRRETSIFSFEASQVIDEKYAFTLDNVDVTTDFTMKKKYLDRTYLKKQITRPKDSKMFTQGSDGDQIQDSFNQVNERGIVDILMVVDNSGSMYEEQQKLAEKLKALLSKISDTNWKIAITSTTASNNCSISIVTKRQADYETRFQNQINNLGTGGSGDERGIFQARKGLECFRDNGGMRPDSTLAVLIVSDEDNCSNGNCNGGQDGNISFVTNFIENQLKRPIGTEAGFYGIFAKSFASCSTAYNVGNTYTQLLAFRKGNYSVSEESRFGSICDPSYEQTLESISTGIASQVKASFILSRKPDDPAQVEISFNSPTAQKVPASHYIISEKTITFKPGFLPPLGSSIYAKYRSGATPKFKNFTLNSMPAPDSVRVQIDGKMIDNTLFEVENNIVKFQDFPASNSEIQISYKLNILLPSSFSIPGKVKPNTIKVMVDDQEQKEYRFENNEILFKAAPPESSEIKITYTEDLGEILTYQVPTMGNNPRNFRLSLNNEPLDAERDGEVFTINSADFLEDEKVLVSYEIDNTEEMTFQLPSLPIDDSISISSSQEICLETEDFRIEADIIKTNCPVIDKTEFVVNYQHLEEKSEFEVSEITEVDSSHLKVYIDGIPTNAFRQENNKIILDSAPPLGANVSVFYTKNL